MALGGVPQAQLKREFDQLAKEIFEIDLKILSFRSQYNCTHIPALEAAKSGLPQQILQCEIHLEHKKAQTRKRRGRH